MGKHCGCKKTCHKESKKPCSEKCCVKVAFIGLITSVDLSSAVPYIDEARKVYPVKDLVYDYVAVTPVPPSPDDPNYNADFAIWLNTILSPAILQLDSKVQSFVNCEFQYIGLPGLSRLVGPYINGFATDANGNDFPIPGFTPINISKRYPKTFFLESNIGTDAVCNASNVYRFSDVNTGNDESLILGNFLSFGLGANLSSLVIFVYQSDDAFATQFYTLLQGVVTGAGIPNTTFGYTVTAGVANAGAIALAGAAINAAVLNGALTNVTICLIPSGLTENQDALATAMNLDSLFLNTSSKLTYYGANFGPVNVAVNLVPINGGLAAAGALPTKFQSGLGLPTDWPTYFTNTLQINLAFLMSYVWAATCRTSDNGLGQELKFDTCNTIINQFLSATIYPPGSFIPAPPKTLQFNGRFWGASAIY